MLTDLICSVLWSEVEEALQVQQMKQHVMLQSWDFTITSHFIAIFSQIFAQQPFRFCDFVQLQPPAWMDGVMEVLSDTENPGDLFSNPDFDMDDIFKEPELDLASTAAPGSGQDSEKPSRQRTDKNKKRKRKAKASGSGSSESSLLSDDDDQPLVNLRQSQAAQSAGDSRASGSVPGREKPSQPQETCVCALCGGKPSQDSFGGAGLLDGSGDKKKERNKTTNQKMDKTVDR